MAKFLLILRYCLVGASVATMYSTLVVLLVDGLNFTVPFLASATAFIVTVPLSFVAQKRFTFRNTDVDPRQLRRFVAMALTSFLLAVGSMHLVTHTLHLSYLWGILITWILIPAVNLIINSLWVFGSDAR